MNEASEELRDAASKIIITRKFATANRIHEATQAASRTTSDIDCVYKLGDEYIIVEAKGGLNKNLVLRTRALPSPDHRVVQQGTREYLEDVLRVMDTQRTTKQIASELKKALEQGRIRYFKVEAPLHQEAGEPALKVLRIGEFNLTGVSVP